MSKPIQQQKCTKCLTLKPLSDFYIRRKTKDGSVYKRRRECKTCEIQQAKLYAAQNGEKIKLRERKRMATPKGQFKKYQVAAKRFNKVFELTIEYFEKNSKSSCYYCGSLQSDALAMGVDRTNSKIGYVFDNCVPCCQKCNLAKFTYSPKEFIEHTRRIVKYQEGKNNGINTAIS